MDQWHYTGEYRGNAHSICNLMFSVPEDTPTVFHNGSIYDYRFIMKELAEELEEQFTCFGENTEKCLTFSVPMEKEVTIIHEMGKKSQKLYHTDYNLLIPQDLWQAHCQILLIILLKEVVKLNVNTVMMRENVELAELNTKIACVFLNMQTLEII